MSHTILNSCVAWPAALIAGAAAGSQKSGGSDMSFLALAALGGGGSGNEDTNEPVIPQNQTPVASDISIVLTKEDSSKDFSFIATDADNDTLTYSVTVNPVNGTLSGSGASQTYAASSVPSEAPDFFKYKANDGTADSNEATVSVLRLIISPDPLEAGEGGSISLSAKLIYPDAGYNAGDAGAGGGTITDEGGGVLSEDVSGSVTWNNNGAPVTIDGSGNLSVDSGATPGNYTITANLNLNGSETSYESAIVIQDTTPPGAPAVGTAGTTSTPTNNTKPTWAWTQNGANAGNGTYRYKLYSGTHTADLSTGATEATLTSYTPSSALNAGSYTLYVQERDDAGNWSPSGSFVITVDTSGPSGYSVSIDQGAYINASNQNALSFTFTGAETGAVYSYTITSSGGGSIGPVTGTVSSSSQQITGIDLSSLADGTITLSFSLTDEAGNTGAVSADTTVKDTEAPAAPSSAPSITSGSDTGVSSSDGITSNTTPSFTVSCTDQNTVQLYVDGVQSGFSGTCSGGTVTLTAADLADGSHAITAKQTDAAGNESPASAGFSVTVDTTGPSAVSDLSVNSGTASVNLNWTNPMVSDSDADMVALVILRSESSFPSSPDAGTPVFNGNGTAFSDTGLNPGTTYYYSVWTYDKAGNYSVVNQKTVNTLDYVAVSIASTAGTHTNVSPIPLTITFTENVTGFTADDITVSNGIKGALSGSGASYSIDITPGDPGTVIINIAANTVSRENSAAPQLSIIYDIEAPYEPVVTMTGISPTSDTTPQWTWTSGGNSGNGQYRYKLYNGIHTADMSAGTTETTGLSYTPGSALADGEYTLYVQERDAAGNWSDPGSFKIIIDTSVPNAPAVGTTGTTPTTNVTPSWQWISNGGGNGTFRYKLYSGTHTADMSIGTTETNGTSFTPGSALSEGEYSLYVQERNDIGNWSASGSYTIVIDLTGPDAPTVGTAGTTASPTNNTTPTWHWTSGGGNGNGNYRVQLNSQAGAWTSVDTATSWTAPTLTHGTHTLYVQERDAAGNWSASGSYTVVLDLVPPSSPTVGTAGTTATPANDTTPTWNWVSGGGDGTGNYRYNVNGGSWFETTATSYTPGTPWGDGSYTLYVQEKDAVGNWSASGLHTIVIDTGAPSGYSVSVDQGSYINASNQTGLSFTFSGAETGTTYSYTITSSGGGTIGPITGTVTSADQTISGINVSGLTDGTLTLSVFIQDEAGNQGSTVTDTIVKDAAAPATPGVPDLTAGSDSGIIDSDNITKYQTLDFAVSCTTGDIVQLYNAGVATGTPEVCAGGTVTLTTGVLSHGIRSITARQTDPAGNQSSASAALGVTVDTVVPSSVTSLNLLGGDAEVSMSWTNPGDSDFAGTVIRYKTGSHPTSETDGDPAYSGTGSSHTLTGLINGTTYYFAAFAQDTAGNFSLVTQGSAAPSVDVNVTISTSAANPTNLNTIVYTITFSHVMYSDAGGCISGGSQNSDFTEDDITVTNGTKDALIKGADCSVFTIEINPSGQGNVTVSIPANIAYAFGTVNYNNAASPLIIVYDSIAPNAPAVTGTALQNNTTPPWNWSSGGGDGNGQYRYQMNSESAGGWSAVTADTSYVPASALSEGTYTLYVQERDAAGNWSSSGSFAITVDTTAPNLAITTPAAATVMNGSAVITFTGSEGSTEVSVDGGLTWTAVSSGFAVSDVGGWADISEGSFSLQLRETDAAGNTATTSRSFVKDTISPAFTSVLPASSSIENDAKVSYTLSENLSSGTITWTRTGGTADGTVHSVSLTGTELNSGVHSDIALSNSPALVDGSVYTVTFTGTDAAGNTATTITRTNVTYDATAPVITVTAPASSTHVNHVKVSYSLSEALASGTITWTGTAGPDNGTIHSKVLAAADRTIGDHNNWTIVNFPALVDGSTYTVTFNGTDAAGNSAATVTRTGVVYDVTAPSNQNSVFTSSVTAQGGAPITVNSSGSTGNTIWFAPAGLSTADIAQFVADATHTSAGGTSTSINAPANEGVYYMYVIDAAGNVSPQSVATLTVDNTPPSVTVNQKSGQLDPASSLPIEFTVVFSEAVNPASFDASDITQNGTATGITWNLTTSDNITWNLAATAVGTQGTVQPSVAAGRVSDTAGNLNTISTSTDNTVTYSLVLNVSINKGSSQSSRTNSLPAVFDVNFSYAIADGNFTAADITQTTGTGYATGVTWQVDKVTATYYTVSATASGQGILKPYIQANVVPENNAASTSTDNEVVYELVKPSVTVNQSSGQSDPINANPISFTVVFNEAINPATFAASDFTKSGTASYTLAEPTTSDNITWTVNATASTEGTVIISLPAGAVSDPAGNTSNASTSADNSVTYDVTPPAAVINGAPSGVNNVSSLNVTVSGTDVVSYRYAVYDINDGPAGCADAAYNGSDILIANPITDSLSGKDDGTITLCVRGKDLAGNLMPAASAAVSTWTKDSTSANVNISGQPTGTNNTVVPNITVSPTSGETHYQYKIVSGTSCAAGSYSADITIATPITENYSALPDGSVTVCVIGYKNPNYQTTPTSATWVKDTAAPGVVSAETIDSNGNGKIDHIKITFGSAVDAATFPGYNGGSPVTTTDWLVGSYSNVRIALGMGDTLNDEIIYLAFDEKTDFCDAADQTGCDTGNKPDVTTAANPGLKDVYGNNVSQISTAGVTEADGAMPVVIGASPPSNITLTLYFSEIVTAATAECGTDSSRPAVDCSTIYSITGGSGLSVTKAVMYSGVGVNGRRVVLTTSEQVHNEAYTVTVSSDTVKDVNNLTAKAPYNTASFSGAAPSTNVISAVAIDNTTVEITFNVTVSSSSAQNASRYTIPGLSVTAANMYPTPGTDSTKVRLTTSSQLSNTANGYTVTVQSGQIAAASGGLTCDSPNNTATFTGDTLPEVQSVASLNEFAVDVIFSEYVLMDSSANGALNPANYTITGSPSGLTVSAVEQLSNIKVRLTTSSQVLDQFYTVTVNNVKDITSPAGNTVSSAANTGNFLGRENLKILSARRVYDYSSAFNVFQVTFSKPLIFEFDSGSNNNAADRITNWSFPSGLGTVSLCTASDDAACPVGYTTGVDTIVYFKTSPEPSLGAYTVVGQSSGANCILPSGGVAPTGCLKSNPDDRASIDFGLPVVITDGPVYNDPFNDDETVAGQVIMYNNKLIIGPNNVDAGIFQTEISLANATSVVFDADKYTAGYQAFDGNLWETCSSGPWPNCSTGSKMAGIDYMYAGCYSADGSVDTTLTGLACTQAGGTEYLFVLGYKTDASQGYQTSWVSTSKTSPFEFTRIGPLSSYTNLTYRAMSVLIYKGWVFQASQHQSGSYAPRWSRFQPDGTIYNGTDGNDLGGRFLWRIGESTDNRQMGNGQGPNQTGLISVDSMYEYDNDGSGGNASQLYIANGGSLNGNQVALSGRARYLSGTVSAANNQRLLTGSGTKFLTQVEVGTVICVSSQCKTVDRIDSDTQLRVSNNWSPAVSAGTQAYYRYSDGGMLRSVAGFSGSDLTNCTSSSDCNTKWEDVTPDHEDWNRFMSIPLPQDAKSGGDWDYLIPGNKITPAIKAVPKMVNFNGNLFAVRNSCATVDYNYILEGTVSGSAGSTALTGSSTQFNSSTPGRGVKVGNEICVKNSANGVIQCRTVSAISSSTSLTVDTAWDSAIASGSKASRGDFIYTGKVCPAGLERPQLWSLPANAGNASAARSAWSFIGNSGDYSTRMSGAYWFDGLSQDQATKTAANTEVTLLVVNGGRLYIGFDNAAYGASIWRTRTGVTNPTSEADFEAVCDTGNACFNSERQFGFGMGSGNKRLFDSISVNDAGTDYLIFNTGDGVNPFKIYRTTNN